MLLIQVCATPKGMLLCHFGRKRGIDFAHFGLESVWFSRELLECMDILIISTLSERERTHVQT